MKEYNEKQKKMITPMNTAHVVGTKYPIDFNYRKRRIPSIRFTLCMPDGMIISIPVFENEDIDNKIKKFVDNWYKATKENPDLFDHFKIDDKCPICGGTMMCHILERGSRIWCLNYPQCNYVETEDSPKARERIYKKYGIQPKIVNKQGCRIIIGNKIAK